MNAFSWLFRSDKNRKSEKRSKRRRQRAMRVEPLEARHMLAASLPFAESFDSEGGSFKISDGTQEWISEEIDISGASGVSISLDALSYDQNSLEQDDYLKLWYRIDSGSWVEFFQHNDDLGSVTIDHAVAETGNTLEIKIEGNVSKTRALDVVARNPNNGNWSVGVSDGNKFTWQPFGGGFPSTVDWQDWVVADFNGDGLRDVAARNPNNNNFSVSVSDGTSFNWQPWGGAFPVGATWENVVVGDFNGDGRDDIAGRNAVNNNWSLAASDGNSFSWQNWTGGFSPQVAWENWVVGDFNGDGRDDIAARNPKNNNWSVDVSDGNGFTWEPWQGGFPGSVIWQDWTADDFNGDGRDDLVARNPNNHNWSAAISTGSSFRWENWQGGFPNTVAWQDWQVGDFNGDGRGDVVARNPNNNNFSVGISDGSSFDWQPWGGRFATSVNWQTWLVGDFNGDGRDNIAARNPGNNNWSLATSDGSGFTWETWGGGFSTAVAWTDWSTTDAAPLPGQGDLNQAYEVDNLTVVFNDGGNELTYPLRGAFYYPWYPQTWTVNGQHVFYEPELDYYSSDDAQVAAQHIEDMDYAKIDVAIASWWGPGAQKEDTRIPMLLDQTVAADSDLKWAMYYEDEGFGDPSVEQLKADLDYLRQHYTDHEAYAYIDGKPVIFVYNADDGDCEVAHRWAEATEGEWYVNLKVFPGYGDCTEQPDSWHQYGPSTADSRHNGNSYVISPGFWRADQDAPSLERDVDRWNQSVRDMVASAEPWQLITTFNEWGEGTAVEPALDWSSNSGYGVYLDALHNDGQLGGDDGSSFNSLAVGESLLSNQFIEANNGQYRLYLQGDGNLVLRELSTGDALWSSGTHGQGGTRLKLQSDGNLVLYTDAGSAVWSTGTVGSGATALTVEDNGTVTLYGGSNVIWSRPTQTSPGGRVPSAQGSFSWGGTQVDYTSIGGLTNGGLESTPAEVGDYEIVSFGASHGGGTGKVDEYFDETKMINQRFQAINVRGEEDKKVEMWIRRNSGQITIDIPSDARAFNFLVLDGNDVSINLGSIDSNSVNRGGDAYDVPNLSGQGLKVLSYFSDDSVELTDVGSGILVFQDWGFGDGDGFATVLYAPGVNPPSSIAIENHAPGGRQYVGILANFNNG